MSVDILFLVGPTGCGKSELAVKLAKKLNGEIVSCDSMLVYCGMDIGTAKPSLRLQKRVPHHLISIISPNRSFSVSQFRILALNAIQVILKKKKLPILVGGSGLYVRALTDGIAPQPRGLGRIRKKLLSTLKKRGLKYLSNRLKRVDPRRASEILPGDERRTVRALEIYEASGIKPSEWRKQKTSLEEMGYTWHLFGIECNREELYLRVNQRVLKMMDNGFLKEVKHLAQKRLSRTARQAIGYHELLNYLKGKLSHDEAISETQKRTRHLAKKQWTWLRKEERVDWVLLDRHQSLVQVEHAILKKWKNLI